MYRGTTPTFSFELPIQASTLTKLSITFRQPGGESIEKTLNDVTRSGQTVTVTLTEAETLSLKAARTLDIQLRAGVGDTRLASQVWTVPVKQILKDGAL